MKTYSNVHRVFFVRLLVFVQIFTLVFHIHVLYFYSLAVVFGCVCAFIFVVCGIKKARAYNRDFPPSQHQRGRFCMSQVHWGRSTPPYIIHKHFPPVPFI